MDTLQIQETIDGSCCRLALHGWIDSSNFHLLEAWLDTNLAKGYTRLVFCCEDLQFVNSAGVRVFLTAVRRVAALDECELVFANIGTSVMNVFEVTGLIKLITRVED